MSSLSPKLYADLVGKPFGREARGPERFDCVGLALELLRRLGRELPPYLSCAEDLHRALATGGPLHDSERIPVPEPGCVVLMSSDVEPARHIGVMVDRHRMLHTNFQVRTAHIVVLETSLWRPRVLGFYRCGARA